jgi:hypothetical protein
LMPREGREVGEGNFAVYHLVRHRLVTQKFHTT